MNDPHFADRSAAVDRGPRLVGLALLILASVGLLVGASTTTAPRPDVALPVAPEETTPWTVAGGPGAGALQRVSAWDAMRTGQ